VQLAARERELVALRETFATFIRITAHEMRTPLQTIHGFARFLTPGLAPAEFEHYLDHIQQDTDRLMAMVDDLGWRSQLESGALEIKPVACDVEPLLLALSQEVERGYRDRYVEMTYAELPPVHADPDRLRDVLRTLLRNAARFSPKGCQPIRLVARPLPAHGHMEFIVRDLGVRIMERYREKIFEPVAVLPRYLGRPRYGLGLGLYVAREFARRMNGDLWLRCTARARNRANGKKPVGNEFVLRVPLASQELANA
jgi:signal transduction histidine kinase